MVYGSVNQASLSEGGLRPELYPFRTRFRTMFHSLKWRLFGFHFRSSLQLFILHASTSNIRIQWSFRNIFQNIFSSRDVPCLRDFIRV